VKCESCQQREATVLYVRIADDQKQAMHLCEACMAKFQGEKAPAADKENAPAAGTSLRCGQCGMSYEEFKKVGRLGCGACYAAFGAPLERLLKRIHGTTQHRGKGAVARRALLSPEEELAQLREQLETAVAAEAYEQAAQLRDRIALLERELENHPR